MRRALASAALAALLLTLPRPASADAPFRIDLIEEKSLKLDGVPKEWNTLQALSTSIKGAAKKPDLEAKVAIAYDANSVFVAADVTDDVFKPGGDYVELVLQIPGGGTTEIQLFPGDPGKTPGSAKLKDGTAVGGAKVIEAPHAGGWSLEAKIPWSAFAGAKTTRVGLRGAVFVHDVDSGGSEKNIIGSGSKSSLPLVAMEPEQAVTDGLLHDKGIKSAPRFDLLANVASDGMKERVLVYDRFLVVLGSSFRKGSEYYWSDLGVDGSMVPSVETRDLTGDGQDEILIRKRFGSATKYREALVVLGFGASDTPTVLFTHEVGITTEQGAITNQVSFVADGAKQAIKITPGSPRSFTVDNYKEPLETSMDAALLPWGTVASQTYKLSGTTFSKASEDKQAGLAPSAPSSQDVSLPKAPPPPSAAELQEKVYELYKKERSASGKPRFDLAVDVGGGNETERVLLHDRDLVIFGKGWKGGTGYSFLTLQQFASASDILEVTAKDTTGDGKAEIIVRGVVHANAPKEAGGGTVDREIVLVFTMSGDAPKRVFAVEVARSIGKKRVASTLSFTGKEIEIAPGRASDWTEKTYPFNQDTSPVGGVEPLQLPWGGGHSVRYKWSGSSYAK